jgi:hypothetical protein
MAGPRPGTTRSCPHCKAIILESVTVCPGCQHHLRFGPMAGQRALAVKPALRVEGAIRHPGNEEPWEYSVVISIRNERDEEVARQVIGVGALLPSEQRTFRLAVDVISAAKEEPAAAPAPQPSKSAAAPAVPKAAATQDSGARPASPTPTPVTVDPGVPPQPSRSLQPPKALSPMKPVQQGTKRYY